MIKEAKDIDFYTTGREPNKQDFAKINEWIIKDKQNGSFKIRQTKASKKQLATAGKTRLSSF